MEGDFYSSLSNLCAMRGITLPETKALGFPYNMALAMQYLQAELKSGSADDADIRLVQDGDGVFFARQERFDTGMTLYYIPVEPLFVMLRDKKRKQATKLLLSVFAYLYQVADIPYHRQEGTYLFYTYDMLNDWKMQDEEDDLEFQNAYRQMEYIGDVILQRIQNPENLRQFENRLSGFRARDEFDRDCRGLAERTFALFSQYPDARIHRSFSQAPWNEGDDDEGRQIALDNYVSFYGSADGELSDLLIETINTDLQEFSGIDEPVIYLPLDGREIKDNNFDFETRLFALLEELSTFLNDYSH